MATGFSDLPTDDQQAIGKTLLTLLASFRNRDAEALHAVYSDDADWVNAFGTVKRGRDEIVDYLAEKWRGIKVGDPMEEGTDVGPLANARAVARTEGFVASAKADGAKVVVGGGRPEGVPTGGFWFEPTLLADVDNSMEVAQEEVFGPVTCVIPYDDIDDAVRIANDSKYGLAASVYSADAEAAIAIARRIRSGTVAINIAGVCMTEPFGGVKQSGWGRECGSEGIFEFTDIKQILLTSGLGFDPTAG